jgi:hypothetical protein
VAVRSRAPQRDRRRPHITKYGCSTRSAENAACQSGARISSSASRRAKLVVRRLTSVECSLVARRSGSPGPDLVAGAALRGAASQAVPGAPSSTGRSWCAWCIGTQVGRPLRGNQHHVSTLATEPGRQENPCVAGRFHHDGELTGSLPAGSRSYSCSSSVAVVRNSVSRPQEFAAFVGQAGLVRRAHGDVDSHPEDHCGLPWSLGLAAGGQRPWEVDPHQTFANRDPHQQVWQWGRQAASRASRTSCSDPARQQGQRARSRNALHSDKER